MKRFIKQAYHSKIGRVARNFTGFRPPIFLYDYEEEYLASDLFVWRTDHGFETIFKATNILEKFYGITSILKFIFYDNLGNFLREMDLEFSEGALSFLINENLLGRSGYGTFCVFNCPKKQTSKQISITNRCYVGYGKESAFSMFHGNIVSLMVHPTKPINEFENSIVPAVTSRKGVYRYTIQKNFDLDATTTLCFSNPLNRVINFSVNRVKGTINSRGCNLFPVIDNQLDGLITIESDFMFPRPIIICEKGDYLDCHHA